MLILYLNFKPNGSVGQVLGRTGKGNQSSNSKAGIKSKATDKLRNNQDEVSNGEEKASQAEGLKTSFSHCLIYFYPAFNKERCNRNTNVFLLNEDEFR